MLFEENRSKCGVKELPIADCRLPNELKECGMRSERRGELVLDDPGVSREGGEGGEGLGKGVSVFSSRPSWPSRETSSLQPFVVYATKGGTALPGASSAK
jgi:hypothetical protein